MEYRIISIIILLLLLLLLCYTVTSDSKSSVYRGDIFTPFFTLERVTV